ATVITQAEAFRYALSRLRGPEVEFGDIFGEAERRPVSREQHRDGITRGGHDLRQESRHASGAARHLLQERELIDERLAAGVDGGVRAEPEAGDAVAVASA